jgi:AraC-like DNA-binding protein
VNAEETWQETAGGNMQSNGTDNALRSHPLGEPLTIDEVANLLGCSPWTVRQRYLRQGIPYLQARPRGKIVFFREQVVAWIQKRQQQKGGIVR